MSVRLSERLSAFRADSDRREPILVRPDGTPYAEWSFGFLRVTNPVRQEAIRLIQWSSTPQRTLQLATRRRPRRTIPPKIAHTTHSPPRLAAFDQVILLCILVNCVFMALNPPFEHLERDSESIFISIFTLEMTLKMVRLPASPATS